MDDKEINENLSDLTILSRLSYKNKIMIVANHLKLVAERLVGEQKSDHIIELIKIKDLVEDIIRAARPIPIVEPDPPDDDDNELDTKAPVTKPIVCPHCGEPL